MKWPEVALGDLVADLQSGFASGKNVPDGVVQVRMNNIGSDGQLDWTKIRRVPRPKRVEALRAEPGDILFNATNSPELVGKTALFRGRQEDVYYSNHFYRLRPEVGRADSAYLTRFIQKRWQEKAFAGMCKRWVNQATVSKDNLLTLKVPLPPFEEQKRIAAILDRADALRRLRQQAIDRLNTLSQSIFHEMFVRERCNERPLSELVEDIQMGPFGSLLHKSDYVDGGVPLINPMHIVAGRIAPDMKFSVSEEKAKKLDRYRLRSGQIILGRRGEMGRCAVVDEEHAGMICGTGSMTLTPRNDDLNSDFFFFFLRTDTSKARMENAASGVTMLNLNSKSLDHVPIPTPPKLEQDRFSRRLRHIERLADRYQRDFSSLMSLFASLQQSAFAGEL